MNKSSNSHTQDSTDNVKDVYDDENIPNIDRPMKNKYCEEPLPESSRPRKDGPGGD